MRSIDTPRLFLRLPDAADAQPLLDIHEHPDVIKYVVSNSMRRGISGAWSSVAMMLGHGNCVAMANGRSSRKRRMK